MIHPFFSADAVRLFPAENILNRLQITTAVDIVKGDR